jgi:alkylated DNA repair protein alkB family protein 1
MKASERQYKECRTLADAEMLGCRMELPLGEVVGYPGLHVVRISPDEQLDLATECLVTHINPPNTTNILKGKVYSCRPPSMLPGDSLWEIESAHLQDLQLQEPPLPTSIPTNLRLSQLRWVTLGYQYDWTLRSYPDQVVPEADNPTPFPMALAALCRKLVSACGYDAGVFRPEAGIVNFYPHNAVMGAHTDEVEKTHEPPVVSISLGPPCVFLVGGLTKNDKPLALLLRTGDVVVMGGLSRLRYHAVPRVFTELGLPAELEVLRRTPPTDETEGNNTQHKILNFLATTRININVRQVFD